MADAYNVRANGDRYYVYRLDGNVPVGEYIGPGAAARAQADAAQRNQQHNERFGKKKEDAEQSLVPHTEGWIEGGDETQRETTVGHPDVTPSDTRPDPSEEQPAESAESSSEAAPNLAPGTGVSYKVPKQERIPNRDSKPTDKD